jgi:hypothetical protein
VVLRIPWSCGSMARSTSVLSTAASGPPFPEIQIPLGPKWPIIVRRSVLSHHALLSDCLKPCTNRTNSDDREWMLKTCITDLRSKVRYPDKIGGGFVVSLGFAHQIHYLASHTCNTAFVLGSHMCRTCFAQPFGCWSIVIPQIFHSKAPRSSPYASW